MTYRIRRAVQGPAAIGGAPRRRCRSGVRPHDPSPPAALPANQRRDAMPPQQQSEVADRSSAPAPRPADNSSPQSVRADLCSVRTAPADLRVRALRPGLSVMATLAAGNMLSVIFSRHDERSISFCPCPGIQALQTLRWRRVGCGTRA